MIRIFKRTIFAACCTGLISGVCLYFLYEHRMEPSSTQSEFFEVASGESISQISTRLENKGYILSATFFNGVARVMQFDRSLMAGKFRLGPRQRVIDILQVLTRLPETISQKITFPEGVNKWQIADRMSKHGWSKARVLAFIDQGKLEGKLFPDTYLFVVDSTEEDLLMRMNDRFNSVWKDLKVKHPHHPSLSDTELITLASMVEKEMAQSTEAPTIARVFLNRIKLGMKLQSDPTYVYSADRYGKKPTRSDRLRSGNPYNTDQIVGLPPGPIANSGRIALTAALAPDTSKRAQKLVYFVAKRDGSGTHHFSETYSEHRKAIHRFLKKPNR